MFILIHKLSFLILLLLTKFYNTKMLVNSESNHIPNDYNYWGVGSFYISFITLILILILVIFGYLAIFRKREHQEKVDLEKVQMQSNPFNYQIRYF